MDEQLARVRAALSEEEWQARVSEAERQAQVLRRVQQHVAEGMTKRAAFQLEGPDEPRTTWVARFRRFEALGPDGLIDRSMPVKGRTTITPELVAQVRGLAQALSHMGMPARSPTLRRQLIALTGQSVSIATVKRLMVLAGVAQPVGRPAPQPLVEPHPLAGAELLLAFDDNIGATRALAEHLHQHLQALPQPDGVPLDDTDHRDDNGRFLPAYNQPQPRTEPELGADFDSVELKRPGKDLPQMRVANTSLETLQRKLRALMLLPVVTDSPRWAALRHWEGEHLGALVGIAYQPATLDKFLRELKYADVTQALQEAFAAFWLGQTDLLDGPIDGMAVLYADTATKPVWTHHFTRCAKVSSTGRVMPAVATTYLHAGPGTPLLCRTSSGSTSLTSEVPALLEDYEAVAGEQTVRRLVVMDREGQSVALMKTLQARGWQFIVPLKRSVTGPNAKFEALTPWGPYQDAGDELRGGYLWLNDSKARKEPLKVRVVARKRHRTGAVAWYATLVEPQLVSDSALLDAYFERWPLQELRFRDGNGRVHLDAHYGYGKRKVDNVAVLDRTDTLAGQLRAIESALKDERQTVADGRAALQAVQAAIDTSLPQIEADRERLDAAMGVGQQLTPEIQQAYATLRTWEKWLDSRRQQVASLHEGLERAQAAVARSETSLARKQAELDQLAGRQRIFTVDVALDQLMNALKLTFMNLAALWMARFLPAPRLQLDTLIRGVLTLPGERQITTERHTIRLYRHDRDHELMERVAEACQRLNDLQLTREGRALRFELVDPPRRPAPARGAMVDTV